MSNLAYEQARPPAPSFDLTGKRVVVVGGKQAIGLGVAQAAHAMGAAVTVASRRQYPRRSIRSWLRSTRSFWTLATRQP